MNIASSANYRKRSIKKQPLNLLKLKIESWDCRDTLEEECYSQKNRQEEYACVTLRGRGTSEEKMGHKYSGHLEMECSCSIQWEASK